MDAGMIKGAQKNTEEIIKNHKETRMVRDEEDSLSNRPQASTVYMTVIP